MSFRTGHQSDRESQNYSESQRRFTDPLKVRASEIPGRNETKGIGYMSQVIDRKTFKAEVLPNIEPLLQVSLWLTRNGLDASTLMREALAEAYRTWNVEVPKESCSVWLRKILIKRFFVGYQRHVRLIPPGVSTVYGIPVEECLKTYPMTTQAQLQSWRTSGSDDDSGYFEAIAGLPAVCRSAMILSYLEGFSNKEIADLGGVNPHTIESALSQGRSFIREELFEHLMGSVNPNSGADRKAALSRN